MFAAATEFWGNRRGMGYGTLVAVAVVVPPIVVMGFLWRLCLRKWAVAKRLLLQLLIW